ncbi:MAG: hypothetical protein R3C08_01420 [Hyphomonas sp.]|nr:hypothetical protein [Hyphomonas sp.]HRX73127.1 hypothetical protein [Hyphomonas sp.]
MRDAPRYAGANNRHMTRNTQRERDMIHPSLLAIAAIVVVFGVLNLIEFKRLD